MRKIQSALNLPALLVLTVLFARCQADKVITVSADGENTAACWEGRSETACLSLDFALGGLESGATVQVHYSHAFSNTTWANVSKPMRGIALVGVGQPVIHCTLMGVGLAFSHQFNVTIAGLTWEGCSLRTPTASFVDGMLIEAYRGLFFYNVTNLAIEDCHFSSLGRGAGVAMYDVTGNVQITNSHFLDNTIEKDLRCPDTYNTSAPVTCSPQGGGVYIELMECEGFAECNTSSSHGVSNSTYTIDGCTFENNSNYFSFHDALQHTFATHYSRSFGHGGGLGLSVLGQCQGNRFTITDSQFVNNTAYSGAGLYMLFLSDTQDNSVTFAGVEFTGNEAAGAEGSGGGVALGVVVANIDNQPNGFFFHNVTMVNNHAIWGGGVVVYFGNFSHTLRQFFSHGLTLNFSDCNWRSNVAVRAGAAISIFHFIPIDTIITTSTNFTDCTFVDNSIPRVSGRTKRHGYGVVYSMAAPLFFGGTTVFTGNIGSALAISAAKVHFAGDVEFRDNHGFVGGAIYLMDISALYLLRGLNMRLNYNSAFDTGGAIHYIYPGARGAGSCLFEYEDHTLPPSKWNATLSFSGNKALYGGSAIFLSDPSGCHWPNGEHLFDTNKTHPLNFSGNHPETYGPILGTPPINLTFESPVVFANDTYWLELMPGQMLDIPVKIQDYFNSSSVTATLDTKCYNHSRFVKDEFFDDLCRPGTDISYTGPRVFVASQSITGIKLGGPQNNKDLVLVLKTVTTESQAIVSVLRVSFNECGYGFYFDNTTKTCQCYDDGNAVRCFSFNGSNQPCIMIGHWYGTIETSGGTSNAEASCTLDSCSTSCDEKCLDIEGWCKLPQHDYDLCTHHHSGPLCAYCLEGYSPNYGQLHCVRSEECSAGKTVLMVVLMSAFWAVIIIALLVILRLNLRLGSGYTYGFIYYFSVLPFIAGNVIQSHAFSGFLSFFTSIVHLDPHFLMFIKICFAKDITPVQLEFFHYFHPLLVSALVYAIIMFNKHFPKVPILSVYAPVHAICLILLLSYTSLFQTSFTILQPIRFLNSQPKSSQLFAKLQPNTPYFDPKDHLPYALVALVVEMFLILPFTVGMLLAPWLMRWRWMIKFKPIVDEFQACYKDRYRWFAGYYLLCRQLIALPPFFINAPSGSIFVQQILNMVILLIHAYVQPYRERWLNLLDTIFLFDLALVSILSGNTAQMVFSGTFFDIKLICKIIMITIPCLYLILACCVVLGLKFQTWYQTKYPSSVSHDNPDGPPPHSEGYDIIPDRRRETRATVSVVSFQPSDPDSREENPLLQHETEALSAIVVDTPSGPSQDRRSTSSSRKSIILRRVASGLSSHVSYWRNTGAQSVSYRVSSDRESLPDLREDESMRL